MVKRRQEESEGTFDQDDDDDEEDTNFNEAGEVLEPFNLKNERQEGYFDTNGNFVWKMQDQETDAWLAGLDDAAMEEAIGQAQQAQRLTDLADHLMQRGLTEVYYSTKEALQDMGKDEDEATAGANGHAAQASNSSVQFEYLGKDGQVHGPFSMVQMYSWVSSGYFSGDNVVKMRPITPVGTAPTAAGTEIWMTMKRTNQDKPHLLKHKMQVVSKLALLKEGNG
ncbi:hypothetical protein JKP88DRAFT_349493 [Tribonema minus]|uniref:GYF domain-containing protein n=1 Tax=Tribonema minus TaxID=303371 RepID=A0A836CCE7_9STRA|nr:hypothetical protein JKP88DRAFT_349493 [Tribonema minus]